MKTSTPSISLRTLGIAAITLVGAPILRGQSAYTCDEGKPFTAQMIEHIVARGPDGTESRVEFGGLRARDREGRVYAELRTIRSAGPKKQTEPLGDSGIHFGHSNRSEFNSVSISDCHSGEDITAFPDLQVARVTKNSNASSWKRKDGASLFEFLTSGPRSPNVIFEDLGFREIEGLQTHGYRTTVLGTGDDGDASGVVKNITEWWISDDLAEIILQVMTNLKGKSETTIMLTGIKREEPPASLFEIPSGYKIDVHPDDKQPRTQR